MPTNIVLEVCSAALEGDLVAFLVATEYHVVSARVCPGVIPRHRCLEARAQHRLSIDGRLWTWAPVSAALR